MRTDSRIQARTAVRAVFIVFPTVLPLPTEDRRALWREGVHMLCDVAAPICKFNDLVCNSGELIVMLVIFFANLANYFEF